MKQPKKKHWLLGSQTYLSLENNKEGYFFGVEPEIKKVFVETDIKEAVLWKYLIPRYYECLVREGLLKYQAWKRKQQARLVRMYDPLITVHNDTISFFMRDRLQENYVELELNSCVFNNENFQTGFCFVDFNTDFINQVKRLKKNDVQFLKIDDTGLQYIDDEETTHLPNEDRGTLIHLLQSIRSEFNSSANIEVEIDSEIMWNQVAMRTPKTSRFERTPRRRHNRGNFQSVAIGDQLKPQYENRFITGIGDKGYKTLFDYSFEGISHRGQIDNPAWYLTLGSKTPFEKSRFAKFLGKKTVVKLWDTEESSDALIEIPLEKDGMTLGRIKVLTPSRRKRFGN
jgi:hypothetical protein